MEGLRTQRGERGTRGECGTRGERFGQGKNAIGPFEAMTSTTMLSPLAKGLNAAPQPTLGHRLYSSPYLRFMNAAASPFSSYTGPQSTSQYHVWLRFFHMLLRK